MINLTDNNNEDARILIIVFYDSRLLIYLSRPICRIIVNTNNLHRAFTLDFTNSP